MGRNLVWGTNHDSLLGVFMGLPAEQVFGRSRTWSRCFGCGSYERAVLTEGELLELCCNGCQKKMLPNNTQAIKGL